MLSARQLLLMRLARDRAIDIAIAPLGTVVLLPDPDLRRCVFRCVSHVEAHVCRSCSALPQTGDRIGSSLRLGSRQSTCRLAGLAAEFARRARIDYRRGD